MAFDIGQIVGLVEQLGGDRQQAAAALSQVEKVDPKLHGEILQNLGIDPDKLFSGGYDAQLPGSTQQ